MKPYRYETCCVLSTAEDINAMTAVASDVTYETMQRNCEGLSEWAQEMGYTPGMGLSLKKDRMVEFCKSKYKGVPCFYLVHSRIEHIWTRWPDFLGNKR